MSTAQKAQIKGALEEFRHGLSQRFPDLLDRVMEGYLSFSGDNQKEEDAKEFSTHHGACKAALAHLDLLIKLAAWAEKGGEDGSLPQGENIEKLIDEAHTALCSQKEGSA